MDKMNFLVCATRNMYPQLHRMFVMLGRTQETPFHIYAFVEDDLDITGENVTIVNISSFKNIRDNQINGRTHFTWMTLARCYAADILIDVDKLIYLDLDVEIMGDLREFWDTDMEGNLIAGVIDQGIKRFNISYLKGVENYINAGVMIMDLHGIREFGITYGLDDLLNTWSMHYADQDAINLTCKGKIKLLDNKWNSGPSTGVAEDEVIHHCTDGAKPWDPRSKFFPSFARDYVNNGAPFSVL